MLACIHSKERKKDRYIDRLHTHIHIYIYTIAIYLCTYIQDIHVRFILAFAVHSQRYGGKLHPFDPFNPSALGKLRFAKASTRL